MVTMATMEMNNFAPQNHIFGRGTTASKGLHELFSVIYVHISVRNQDIFGVAGLWYYLGDTGI